MIYKAKLSDNGKIVMENMYYNHCLRCGRKLQSEESRQRGYGDICYEKSQNTENTQKIRLF